MTLSNPTSHDDAIRSLKMQAEENCQTQDHITLVIGGLEIPEDAFTDQFGSTARADFSFESVVKMFLYKNALGLSQTDLHNRLKEAEFVYLRLGMKRFPSQQTISYTWRNRLSPSDRSLITEAASEIRDVCDEYGVTGRTKTAIEPDETNANEAINRDHAANAIQKASELAFTKFDTKRASNAKYADQVFFERHGFSAMTDSGTTGDGTLLARITDREEIPHGRTQERTLKKIATPEPQTDLADFTTGRRTPEWKRIRDEVLEPFHDGVGEILEETIERKDGHGVREPVNVAIDVTEWTFYGSPTKDPADDGPKETLDSQDGDQTYIDPEYPDLVSGTPGDHKRAFKFATVSIVAGDRPFILGIEPVREGSWWEPENPQTSTKGDIVDRLLNQAEQHVEINKVFLDRGFDVQGVKDCIDRRDLTYLIPKRKREKEWDAISEIEQHPWSDCAVEREVPLTVDGRTHTTSIMYVPSRKDDGDYAVFSTNRDIEPESAPGFCTQYQQRWEIENEYKSIKANFLPPSGSSDYRMRFLYFTLGVILYNVWRLANYFILEATDKDSEPGASAIRATEIVYYISFYIDPGG